MTRKKAFLGLGARRGCMRDHRHGSENFIHTTPPRRRPLPNTQPPALNADVDFGVAPPENGAALPGTGCNTAGVGGATRPLRVFEPPPRS